MTLANDVAASEVASVGMVGRLCKLGKRWYELPDSKGRISSMEGIRGLAVLLVFCVHYHDLLSVYLPRGTWQFEISYFIGQIGHCGVDLFFILSGYLIYGATIKPKLDVVKFLGRRIQRIYPTFLAVFAIYLVLSFLFPERSKIPEGLWATLVFFAGNLLLMAGLFNVEPLITVAWSLSFEMFYYLTLPILVWATGMRSWSRSARVTFFLGVAGLYVVLFLSGPLFRPGYWTPARMLVFVAGIVLYERMRASPPVIFSPARELVVALLFVASFGALFYLHQLTLLPGLSRMQLGVLTLGKVFVTAVPYALLCLYCFGPGRKLRRLFEWSPLRWLGNMSFSYYLIHALVIHFFAMVMQRLLPPGAYGPAVYWLALPLILVATLMVATILFLAVERPLSLRPRST